MKKETNKLAATYFLSALVDKLSTLKPQKLSRLEASFLKAFLLWFAKQPSNKDLYRHLIKLSTKIDNLSSEDRNYIVSILEIAIYDSESNSKQSKCNMDNANRIG